MEILEIRILAASGNNHVISCPMSQSDSKSIGHQLRISWHGHDGDMKHQFARSMAWFACLPWTVELDIPPRTGTSASI